MASSLLDLCRGGPERELAAGDVLIEGGERSGRLFVPVAGTLEDYLGDVAFVTATEPGAMLGEMSVLLDLPHTASVRAIVPSKVHVVERAAEFLEALQGLRAAVQDRRARSRRCSPTSSAPASWSRPASTARSSRSARPAPTAPARPASASPRCWR